MGIRPGRRFQAPFRRPRDDRRVLDAARPTRDRARPAPLPLPRVWSVRASDIVALVGLNAVVIAGMWVRHGGLDELGDASGVLTAAGQLTALFGTYAALLQLVLMSRAPFLDQTFGMDRLAWYHRWLGFATFWLLLCHGVCTTIGYALGDGIGLVDEFVTLVTRYDFVLLAVAGMACLTAVAISSFQAARRRLSYETWYGIHLYAYLGIALAFAHQLVTGLDFQDDPIARLYWIGLYVVTVGLIVAFRIGQPVATSLRHRLRVGNVVVEGPGVVSIYVTGRDLDRLPVRAGQYFLWRFLTRDGWWRAHPFSISAAPNGRYLRLTVKDLGDWTRALQRVPIGTRVIVEGPYGIMTGARRTRAGVLLIAGGIGITPIRAMLEAFAGRPGDITLLYRAGRQEDLVFRRELDYLAAVRGATVHYAVGRRAIEGSEHDPLGPSALRRMAPDIVRRDVYVCGPPPMMDVVRRSLRTLAVPDSQVHWERFSY